MGEFGHFYAAGPGFHIDAWGAGPFVIVSGSRSWRFEFSDRFGPILLDRNNSPKDFQPASERDPFWHPFQAWLAQGKRTEPDGVTCIWDEPKPTLVRRVKIKGVRGTSLLIVENGEDGGKLIEPTPAGRKALEEA